MKKAIFGGTFDPIHIGHLHIAYEALYSLILDEIIFIPNGNPPHKSNKRITNSEIRYEMVKEAISNEPKFSISDYEITKREISYTYNTIEHFKNLEPTTEWYFLVGLDSLMGLKSWKNVKRILECCTLVVFNRSGYTNEEVTKMKCEIEEEYGKRIIILPISILEISSTEIKYKISQGKVINYLIPPSAEKIINKYNLYRNKV